MSEDTKQHSTTLLKAGTACDLRPRRAQSSFGRFCDLARAREQSLAATSRLVNGPDLQLAGCSCRPPRQCSYPCCSIQPGNTVAMWLDYKLSSFIECILGSIVPSPDTSESPYMKGHTIQPGQLQALQSAALWQPSASCIDTQQISPDSRAHLLVRH